MTKGLKLRDVDGLIMTGYKNKEKSYSYSLLHLGSSWSGQKKKKKKEVRSSFPKKTGLLPEMPDWESEIWHQTREMVSATEMAMQKQIPISQAQSQRGMQRANFFQWRRPSKTWDSYARIGQRTKINCKLMKSGSSLLMARRTWLQGLF